MIRICASSSSLPRSWRKYSSSKAASKWSSIARLLRPVTMMISDSPEATASSTTYWMVGLSTSGSISLGWALVAGRNRVPRPAAGKTALRTFMGRLLSGGADGGPVVPVERLLDPAAELHLGCETALRGDPDGEAKNRVAAAPSHDTLRARRVQREA